MTDEADEIEGKAARQPQDACSGVLILAAGLGATALCFELPIGTVAHPAAGTFPLLLSLVLTFLGAVLTLQQIRAGFNWSVVSTLGREYGWQLGVFIALSAIYLVGFDAAGFLPSTAFFLAALLWYFQGVPLWKSVLYALVVSAISYALFNDVFQLRLPDGPIRFW
ncbi:MAG: tripartite tricarboxylate transporter TctB family protein [Hyphomicrobiaceae bacterium]